MYRLQWVLQLIIPSSKTSNAQKYEIEDPIPIHKSKGRKVENMISEIHIPREEKEKRCSQKMAFPIRATCAFDAGVYR